LKLLSRHSTENGLLFSFGRGLNAEFSLQNYANLLYFGILRNCVLRGRVPAERACLRARAGTLGHATGIAACFDGNVSHVPLFALLWAVDFTRFRLQARMMVR
jgi:hypothetical protein